MKQSEFELHRKRATEIYQQTKSTRKSAKILSEELGENVVHSNFVRAGITNNQWKEEINSEKDSEKYKVEDEDIVFYYQSKNSLGDTITKRIAIPLDEVKEICFAYSIHGNNRTGTQIMQDFELNEKAWELIKSRI